MQKPPITATPLPPPTQPPPTETPLLPSITPSPLPTNAETATPPPTLTATETATPLTTAIPITTLTPTATVETATATLSSVDIVTATPDFIPSPTPFPGDFNFSVPDAVRVLQSPLPIENVYFDTFKTTDDLIQEIEDAQCTHHTIIHLPPNHVYVLEEIYDTTFFGGTGLPVIRCQISLIGDETEIIRQETAPNFRIFGVEDTGVLRLEGIEVRNGYATSTGGGGILNVFGGQVYLYDSVVEDNTTRQTSTAQTLGAGIYSYEGTLYVENSRIANNTNTSVTGDGGGIGVINALTTIITSDITGNSTTRNGGGVAVLFTGAPQVTNNCITLNNRVNSSGVILSSNGLYGGQGSTNATNNWWGVSNGPSGLGSGSGDAVLGVGVTFSPFATALIPCGVGTSSTPTLADFGISLLSDGQSWTAGEEANILVGANKVSDALSLFNTTGTTLPDKFKTVMGLNLTFLRLAETRPQTTSYGDYYDVFDSQNPSSGVCQVFDPTLVINTIVVACRGFMLQTNSWITNGLVTEYAVVHELGHVLDIRSNNQLRGYVGANLFLADCSAQRVMGVASGVSWTRGQRGWGSAIPDTGTGQEISQFQQNPYDQSSHVETAADMFLNWVYRRNSDAAPTNIPVTFNPTTDADPAPTDACNYTLQGSWEGFKNILRDGTSDSTRSGNVRYWWMEGTLSVIFTSQSWK